MGQIVTEEDATKLWCPRMECRGKFSNCIGSQCMAWSFHDHEHGTGHCTLTKF